MVDNDVVLTSCFLSPVYVWFSTRKRKFKFLSQLIKLAELNQCLCREAKKDGIGKQAHKLLTSIHENFGEISNKILSTNRLRRETAEYEKKIAASATRSLNFDKLQADLDAIRRENSYLEQHLCHNKAIDQV